MLKSLESFYERTDARLMRIIDKYVGLESPLVDRRPVGAFLRITERGNYTLHMGQWNKTFRADSDDQAIEKANKILEKRE